LSAIADVGRIGPSLIEAIAIYEPGNLHTPLQVNG
jgi:hypothetical protein